MVAWRDVQAMLNDCAPGWRAEESAEYYTIYWDDHPPFPRLTRGSHRQRGKPSAEIHALHVRKLARHFKIMDCAKKQLPVLGR
jgi:hypothetical protein